MKSFILGSFLLLAFASCIDNQEYVEKEAVFTAKEDTMLRLMAKNTLLDSLAGVLARNQMEYMAVSLKAKELESDYYRTGDEVIKRRCNKVIAEVNEIARRGLLLRSFADSVVRAK